MFTLVQYKTTWNSVVVSPFSTLFSFCSARFVFTDSKHWKSVSMGKGNRTGGGDEKSTGGKKQAFVSFHSPRDMSRFSPPWCKVEKLLRFCKHARLRGWQTRDICRGFHWNLIHFLSFPVSFPTCIASEMFSKSTHNTRKHKSEIGKAVSVCCSSQTQ